MKQNGVTTMSQQYAIANNIIISSEMIVLLVQLVFNVTHLPSFYITVNYQRFPESSP